MQASEFLRQFEDCTLPPEKFHHADHIRMTWLYLNAHALPQALEKVCTGIRRYATSLGKADRYHETITVAYVLLTLERMRPGEGWEIFREKNPELFTWNPSILDRYYSKKRLASAEAKRIFLWPDR